MIGSLGARGFGAWDKNQAEAIESLCIHGWDNRIGLAGLEWIGWASVGLERVGLDWIGWIGYDGIGWIGWIG